MPILSRVPKTTSPRRSKRMSAGGALSSAPSSHTESESVSSPLIQAKLRIGQPNDRLEKEADLVADHVAKPRTSALPNLSKAPSLAQRKCAACAAEEEIQRKESSSPGHSVAPANLSDNLTQLCGSGRPLDATERSFFEPRIGYDFSNVRLHTSELARQTAHAIDARAFTVGNDVVMADSPTDRRLLAHELTHVIQQNHATANAAIQRACLPASECSGPIVGSATTFSSSESAREVGPRARRKRMTCARATSTGHAGRALQLERFLAAEEPTALANISGIFIDADMSSGTGAFVQDCGTWMTQSLPSGCVPSSMSSATTGKCMFVHGRENQEALEFNNGARSIAGFDRESWRVITLQGLLHEIQHVVFDRAARPAPSAAIASRCPRSSVQFELSELSAIMSEFLPAIRAVHSATGSARTTAETNLSHWFASAVSNPGESLAGALKSMRCICDCGDVDAYVRDTFNATASSWTPAERSAFNTELRQPRWNSPPIGLNWPITP